MIAGMVLAAVAWTAPVSAPTHGAGWAAAPVPGWLEVVEGGDLRRVRLLDGAGDEIPYRLVDPKAQAGERWAVAEVRNLVRTPGGFACDVAGAGLVDALKLDLDGEAGVVDVRVTDAGGGVLVDGLRTGRLRGLEVATVPLPLTDVARLHLEATTLVPGLELRGVWARRAEAPRAVPPVATVAFTVRAAPGRVDAWRLDPVGGPARVVRLRLEVAAPPVFRHRARVLASTGAGSWREVGSARIERIPLADGRPGLESLVVEVRPGANSRLRLEVPAGDEAPLRLTGVVGEGAPRWLVFPVGGSEPPLRLEAGTAGRSRSLETGALPVELAAAAPAAIATRRVVPAPEPARRAQGLPWADLLFVAVAGLLVLLGWRVFRA